MEELVKIFTDNGVVVATLIYFMYRDFKFMTLITTTLTSLQKATENIERFLSNADSCEK